jgi:hypothetical protein
MQGSTTAETERSTSRRRYLGWLAVGALTAMLVLGATGGVAVAATSLHQDTPISWDDPGFQGSEDECESADLAPGEVLWHFVLVQTTSGAVGSPLTATFSSGVEVEGAYKKSGPVLHWNITTGETTLLSASTTATGRMLNLSHICSGGETTTTTTVTTVSETS